MNKMEELIVVTPRSQVFPDKSRTFQGLQYKPEMNREILNRIQKDFGTLKRGEAEDNPAFKQLIPYGIIKKGDQVFVYDRLSGAGETRLHGKSSIGVGGHMNYIEETELMDLIIENLTREIGEEIKLDREFSRVEVVGIINDDSDEVGKVHLGILVIIEVPENSTVEVKETDTLEGSFVDIEKLKSGEYENKLENWSIVALEVL